jgi:hypothetical protein
MKPSAVVVSAFRPPVADLRDAPSFLLISRHFLIEVENLESEKCLYPRPERSSARQIQRFEGPYAWRCSSSRSVRLARRDRRVTRLAQWLQVGELQPPRRVDRDRHQVMHLIGCGHAPFGLAHLTQGLGL